jgi:hypothetical protein
MEGPDVALAATATAVSSLALIWYDQIAVRVS